MKKQIYVKKTTNRKKRRGIQTNFQTQMQDPRIDWTIEKCNEKQRVTNTS